MSKKKDQEKTVKEVATVKEPGLFISRIATEKHEVRGTIFTIEALPKPVSRYVVAKFANIAQAGSTLALITLMFRFGCTAIENLTDSDGNPVEVDWDTIKIDGKKRKALAESITEKLPDDLITLLGGRIMSLNSLSHEETKKLDFTRPSQDEG